jgi:hypothetical protein
MHHTLCCDPLHALSRRWRVPQSKACLQVLGVSSPALAPEHTFPVPQLTVGSAHVPTPLTAEEAPGGGPAGLGCKAESLARNAHGMLHLTLALHAMIWQPLSREGGCCRQLSRNWLTATLPASLANLGTSITHL